MSVGLVCALRSRIPLMLYLCPLNTSTSRNVNSCCDVSNVNLNVGCSSFVVWMNCFNSFSVPVWIMKMSSPKPFQKVDLVLVV